MPPDDPTATGNTPATPEPVDWRPHVPADLRADPELGPIVERLSEKDVGSLVKSHAHLTRKMGNALTLPGKDAKPEEIHGVKQKLYEAGLFTAPPSKPEEYGIAKPENLPDGLGWSDELASELAQLLHKHGAPKALAGDLLPLYEKALLGTQKVLNTNQEKAMVALRNEHGEHFEARKEAVARIMPAIFQDPEELKWANDMGLGDHAGFLSIMMRVAPLALQDSSFMEQLPQSGGQISGEDARAELAKIMSDKNHPDHAGYWRGDKTVNAKVDELYRKAYGNAPVALDAGINETAGSR